jgi:hypothetical protein
VETLQKISFDQMTKIAQPYFKDSWDTNELYKFLIGPKLTPTMIYFGTEQIQKLGQKAILLDGINNNNQQLFILITYTAGCDLFNMEYFYDDGQHIITLNQMYVTDLLGSIKEMLFDNH